MINDFSVIFGDFIKKNTVCSLLHAYECVCLLCFGQYFLNTIIYYSFMVVFYHSFFPFIATIRIYDCNDTIEALELILVDLKIFVKAFIQKQ